MKYNWQLEDWPIFSYNTAEIGKSTFAFGIKSGQMYGTLIAKQNDSQINTIIDLMVTEAIKTSQIEGEFLSRQDVMSSIKKNLGVHEEQTKQVKDHRAKGIAKLMIAVRDTFDKAMSEQMIFDWHQKLMTGNKYINTGVWRTHTSPMQVVSGSVGKETVHFEAPPSSQVPIEMTQYIQWFNDTAPNKPKAIESPLVRAAIAHLYFESIHPFEDGNGRIGRAIAEKALSQGIGSPILISLSSVMEANKKAYYNALKQGQRSNEISKWIQYFSETVLLAQLEAEKLIRFSLQKTQFFDQYKSILNERQTKVISKMLDAGITGFEGGMSAKKYIAITKTSKATATRDLQHLAELGIFKALGGGRSVSYELVM